MMLPYECEASGQSVQQAGLPRTYTSCPKCGRAVGTCQDLSGAWVYEAHSKMAATEARAAMHRDAYGP
jgi:hypothetical protein